MIIENYLEKPKRSYISYYFLGIIGGIFLFCFGLYLFKFITFLIKIVISNWIWIIVGIVGLILIKKIFFRKKKNAKNTNIQV